MEYKKYKLGELFTLKAIKQAKSQSIIPDDFEKGVPYVVQSTRNNMCKTYANKQWLAEHNEAPVPGNAIVLGVTLPSVSYQPYEFGASQVIVARADFLNELTGIYFVTLLQKQMYKFSYQKKPGMELYKNIELEIPINIDGKPNFNYIEKNMKKFKDDCLNNIKDYLSYKKIVTTENSNFAPIIYKEFKLSDIFEIIGTKSLDAGHLQFEDSGYNFVGRTSQRNGIQGKIKKQNFAPNEANTITATVIGNYKYAKVQVEPYYCSQNINKLTPKDKNMTLKALYYLVAYVQKFVSKWNGQQSGYKLDELKNHTILLPTINGERINYQYMESVINQKENDLIRDAYNFINNN